MAGNGGPHTLSDTAVHLYAANRLMIRHVFYNADGEMLIVLQAGKPALWQRNGADGQCRPGR